LPFSVTTSVHVVMSQLLQGLSRFFSNKRLIDMEKEIVSVVFPAQSFFVLLSKKIFSRPIKQCFPPLLKRPKKKFGSGGRERFQRL